ncbi:hypothetical protein [Reinekea sp.]|jgi:hypothetical protein|nr:hypothetical protein [Reinekea sp.]
MTKALPKFLTRRTAAHRAIATLQQWRLYLQGWQDARAALKARKA